MLHTIQNVRAHVGAAGVQFPSLSQVAVAVVTPGEISYPLTHV